MIYRITFEKWVILEISRAEEFFGMHLAMNLKIANASFHIITFTKLHILLEFEQNF
jgi:hypothetical protein